MRHYIMVLPGARIAGDGVLTEGASYVDESMITGESLPVAKAAGDAVVGGRGLHSSTFQLNLSRS